MERDELAGWLRLALTPGVGDGTARRLLAAFGLPDAIFAQSRDALAQVCSTAQAKALGELPPDFDGALSRAWQWLRDADGAPVARAIVTLGDAAYPPDLLHTVDPPLMLYVMGRPHDALTDLAPHAIAIVGSRNPTPQGAVDARLFARSLASSGLTVVSGLALGIDGAAHDGALDGAAPGMALATVAVVGTGLDRVYPARHRDLAHRIAQRGLIVSEFPLGTPPLSPNFPKRNRLIAALSRGTLVVEAALASGSLVTARLAVEQGKEVFAIPGSIHSPQSRGCHALIRQGAKLVESVQDIFEELQPGAAPHGSAPATATDDEDAAPHGLLTQMGHDPVSLDALSARTGQSAADLQVELLELELDGQVARLPGGLFQRMARG
ncbi:DNA processing protein DprA [Xylophilus ampelinus]|nr:DNA-processing protein DprA [Variovorax sp.]VTY39135.1 DNA processing protein DprA [Xylophilus ampelinus]